jgi:hypothetical protein
VIRIEIDTIGNSHMPELCFVGTPANRSLLPIKNLNVKDEADDPAVVGDISRGPTLKLDLR